jgi:cytochrome c
MDIFELQINFMNKGSPFFILIVVVFILIINGCKHDPDFIFENKNNPGNPTTSAECDPDSVYFQNDVLPLLVSTCTTSGCHDEQSAEDGVILVDYLSVIQTGDIKQYDPYDSELYEKITDNDPEERMPPTTENQLTPEQKELIKRWIEQGAKNNYCSSGCDTLNVTYSESIWPTLQTTCFGCHNGENPGGGITITNYNNIVEIAENGLLMGAISHETNYSPMPKNGQKLSDCKITEIKIWIEDGTTNN